MKFEINWPYPIINGGNAEFTQKYSLSVNEKQSYVRAPYFCAGVYISNLINACNVDKEVGGYPDSEAYSAWRAINGDGYLARNYFEGNRNFILYDSMAFPAFCIHKNIKTMLKEVGNGLVQGNLNDLCKCTKDLLDEQTVNILKDNPNDETKQEIIQSCIDAYITPYYKLLTSSINDKGKEFYNSLRDCLEKYNDDKHKLIKEYLSVENKDARCFATFIKKADHAKYVSFSGSVDAKNYDILKWLGKNSPENFVYVAEKICAALKAKFVPINLNTRKYFTYDYSDPISLDSIYQDKSIKDLIDNNVENKVIGEYSCCERKIFGEFNDNTPDGSLYVKFKICAECDLGLNYQRRNGNTIILYDGLRC
ncbi:MAG: hypothetical protein K2N23_05040 [Clostridia bacterium]|nr:hypothetical protein [Clostridia bacterium]